MNQNNKQNSSSTSIREALKATKILGLSLQPPQIDKQTISISQISNEEKVSNMKSQSSKGILKNLKSFANSQSNMTSRTNQSNSNQSSNCSAFDLLQNEASSTMMNSCIVIKNNTNNTNNTNSLLYENSNTNNMNITNIQNSYIRDKNINSYSNSNLTSSSNNNMMMNSIKNIPITNQNQYLNNPYTYIPNQSIESIQTKLDIVTISDNDFQIEDFFLFEDKLFEIVYNFNVPSQIIGYLHDWWLVFSNSSVSGKYSLLTNDKIILSIINDYMNLELLSILTLYHIEVLGNTKALYGKIRNILYYLQYSFNLIYEFMIFSCKFQENNQKWVNKIKMKINKNLKLIKSNEMTLINIGNVSNVSNSNQSIDTIAIIGVNNDKLILLLNEIYSSNLISKNYNEAIAFYQSALSSLHSSSLIILNDFFINKVLIDYNYLFFHKETTAKSINSSSYIPIPISKDKSKKFSLVINFNNTLINLKQTDYDDESEGYEIETRPFLIDFLTEVSKFYEIILFTNENEEFIKPFITEIDNESKYFSYCLFGEHVQYVNGEYLKDMSCLGRDLNRCVVVDCYPSSFKNHVENGILVRRYVGEGSSDKTLYFLEDLLCRIALNKEIDDVRNGLSMYKDEILLKVTCGV